MLKDWTTHTHDLDAGCAPRIDQEWLLTNGTGAYAMGTARGINTRRYHGLLIAARHPPVGRVVLLSQVLEQLILDSQASRPLEFSSCLFHSPDAGDIYSPSGHSQLVRFEKGLSVRWTYRVRDIQLTRELSLPWKSQTAILRYTLRGHGGAGMLRVRPMLALRDFHGLTYRDEGAQPALRIAPDGTQMTLARGGIEAAIACSAGTFVPEANPDAQWWYGVYYPVDAERGQGAREDLHVPGAFEIPIRDGEEAGFCLTVALGSEALACESVAHDATTARAMHLEPIRQALAISHPDVARQARMLAIAADDFVVDRFHQGHKLSTILAGYPWFADWGRDTFIALPGLLLATQRFAEARGTLQVFAQAIRHGLVPNRFDDYDDSAAHYNTVDASLWFARAAVAYVDASGDQQAWQQWLGDAVRAIADAYIHGTDGPIGIDSDGLVVAGHAGTQLTWMDAKYGDEVFTPRHGKAVEINALWYYALRELAARLPDRSATTYDKLADRVAASFPNVFWDEQRGYLRDCVWTDPQGNLRVDASLRPNQLLALSLPHSPLDASRQERVLATVRQALLTPAGPRTLPTHDPNYHGRCIGSPWQRDAAYHRGTVWPWLIGPYAEAVLRVGRFSDDARNEAKAALRPLLDQMAGGGLGQLHEIHDGDPPHRPAGCIAQAWSVGEVLRAWLLACA